MGRGRLCFAVVGAFRIAFLRFVLPFIAVVERPGARAREGGAYITPCPPKGQKKEKKHFFYKGNKTLYAQLKSNKKR